MITQLYDKGKAEVFLWEDNPHLSQTHQWKCFQTLQHPTNSSLFNEIHSSIYESWRNCSRAGLKRSDCSCPALPRWSSPRSKFIGPLMHLPGAIKKNLKKAFPTWDSRGYGPGRACRRTAQRRSHQSPRLPSWMPFTFGSILQHASKLHVRKRKPACPPQRPKKMSVFIKCLPTCPWDIYFNGFSVTSTCCFIGQKITLWLNSEVWNYERQHISTLSIFYSRVCPACTEKTSPLKVGGTNPFI